MICPEEGNSDCDAEVAVTLTCAVRWIVPPVPVQLSENAEVADNGPVLAVPLVARVPLQAPDAVHELASVLDQESVAAPPSETEVGLADRVNVGAGAGDVTSTVTVLRIVPPLPVQSRAKVVACDNAAVCSVPATGLLPLQPPEAVQLVAFVLDHESVDTAPELTLEGDALSVSVGAEAVPLVTVTVAVLAALMPLELEQVSVYELVALSGPTVCEPLSAFVPLHAPLAVHCEAFCELHVSVAVPCGAIDCGEAVREAVGVVEGVDVESL